MSAAADDERSAAVPPTPLSPPSSATAASQLGGAVDDATAPLPQQSSPQHNNSYRHSRAYRHFKNPPQPHMCIRTTTQSGEELFINVLSWTRIVIPQQPSDPIPLYGGMKVPPGSPRCPPLVYAVMANPEVLKDSGRHSKDPEDRGAMVELMCDFVEAMNPDVKLTRNAVILKDRDISGELKDVWNAVQAQRDREREEQILQQRQQQHYHNITTQQMFPKMQTTTEGVEHNPDNKVLYMEFGPETNGTNGNDGSKEDVEPGEQQPLPQPPPSHTTAQSVGGEALSAINRLNDNDANNHHHAMGEMDDVTDSMSNSKPQQQQQQQNSSAINNQVNNSTENSTAIVISQSESEIQIVTAVSGKPTTANSSSSSSLPSSTPVPTTPPVSTATPTPPPPAAASTPTKKEKLGGFLPNGCIFPRFKNSKHKDKDKEKDKDNSKSSTKDKEKTLLNSLKGGSKNKDKQDEAGIPKSQYDKNFINHLESEVEKLDLNKIDTPSNSDKDNNVLIKLKVATSAGGGGK